MLPVISHEKGYSIHSSYTYSCYLVIRALKYESRLGPFRVAVLQVNYPSLCLDFGL